MTTISNQPQVRTKNSPYLTNHCSVTDYENWLREFLPLEKPNGQEALRLIMCSVSKMFEFKDRQGNIKVSIDHDSISYEITHFDPDPFGDVVTTNCVGRSIVPYDNKRAEISVKDRLPTTNRFHPGIVVLGKIPLYQ